MQDYVPSDIPAEPLKAYLTEDMYVELDKKTSPGRVYPIPQSADEVENDTLPEGATLVLNSEELVPETLVEERKPTMALTREKFLGILSRMLADEEITRSQAMEMRRRFGISNASFHAKKINKAKKKKARKLAYHNRRVNRLNGSTRGQTKQQNRSKG